VHDGQSGHMERHTCLFCGDTRMVVYKQLSRLEVLDIIDRQITAGIRDPAIIFLQNFTQCLRVKPSFSSDVAGGIKAGVVPNSDITDDAEAELSSSTNLGSPAPAGADSTTQLCIENEEVVEPEQEGFSQASVDDLSDDSDFEVEEVPIQCCICCYHWISRRKKLSVTVVPMQCLLYFLLGMNTVEIKQCDTRVLTRLATTIAEEKTNVWRSIFRAHELQTIESIIARKKKSAGCEDICCIKRELACFYHAQNGNSMLMGSRNVADMLRAPVTARP